MIINKEEKESLVKTLSWMIADMRHNYNEVKGNLEEGSQGGYNKKLTEAIQLLDIVEKTKAVEIVGKHRRSIQVNCREFNCSHNQQGVCVLSKITLQSLEFPIIGKLVCAEAQEEEGEIKL
jgi:hypothetical protein